MTVSCLVQNSDNWIQQNNFGTDYQPTNRYVIAIFGAPAAYSTKCDIAQPPGIQLVYQSQRHRPYIIAPDDSVPERLTILHLTIVLIQYIKTILSTCKYRIYLNKTKASIVFDLWQVLFQGFKPALKLFKKCKSI